MINIISEEDLHGILLLFPVPPIKTVIGKASGSLAILANVDRAKGIAMLLGLGGFKKVIEQILCILLIKVSSDRG